MMNKPMNILLVEDNDLDIELLKRGLKKIGSESSLVCARDGIEAIQMLENDLLTPTLPRPFVILLDINMPRMNGHEFLEEVRGSPRLHEARVFIFTTSDSKKDVDLAYKNNASGYIVKPNSTSELANVLEALQTFWSLCEVPSEKPPLTHEQRAVLSNELPNTAIP